MQNPVQFLLLALFCSAGAVGQTFSSGSTGVDGALDLTSGDQIVQLPDSGSLNFTTINIPLGRTLTFKNNLKVTPAIVLASGTVNIAGTIDISATSRIPGPGGFAGGLAGEAGLGPGAGLPIQGQQNATWVGPLSLVPNIGGSGGGQPLSDNCGAGTPPAAGGGGGAITIASSASIAVLGAIKANGFHYSCGLIGIDYRGTGAPGAIRLVANSINVPGCTSNECSNFEAAVVRLEAPVGQVNYGGCCGIAPVIATINPKIVPSNPPTLTIISIGGYPVPSYSGSSFSSIDLLLPEQLSDPIPIVVQGTNVPVGSTVTISISGGGGTSTTATLAGSTSMSTATLFLSGLNRSAVTYLFVSATFDATLISTNIQPEGISKIQLATNLGQKTTYRFLRRDGTEARLADVPVELRKIFGL